MPHAVEMPSFLPDDTGPMLSPNRPYELPSHVRGQSYEKANGNVKSSHTSTKGSIVDGTDGYLDVGESGRVQTNGDMQQDAALNSIPNGRSSASSWEHKLSRDGSALSVNGIINGGPDNGRRSPVAQNGQPRTSYGDRSSIASTNGNPLNAAIETKPPTEGDSEPPKRIPLPPPISTNPGSTGPLTYTSSLLPATPVPVETPTRAATASPHRLSSPPSYPSPIAPSPSSTSLQHPGSSQLKHRHTLQVPKAGPSRNSRDDHDAVFTTGRFSPTTLAAGVRRGSLSLARRNTQSIHSNMPHEEIPVDEDAMRWAEAVRQKRASKRKRKDEEDDDRVVVGTKVDQNHANWVTAYNMLTGIRFTVSRTNAKLDRPLTDADFEARHKFSFDMLVCLGDVNRQS
jgi:1-phosphatidylinositol-4-phosphate 5-kinase